MTNDELLPIVIVYVLGATIVAWIAHSQNRSPVAWFAIGLLFSPVIAFVLVILTAPRKR